MKTVILYALVIVTASCIFGCSNNRNRVVGNWRVLEMDDGTTRYLSGEFLDHGDNVISGTLNIRKDDSIEIKLNTDEALGTWKLQGDSLVITKKNLEKSEVFAVIDTGKEIVEYGLADRVIILKENVNGKIFRIDLCKNK